MMSLMNLMTGLGNGSAIRFRAVQRKSRSLRQDQGGEERAKRSRPRYLLRH